MTTHIGIDLQREKYYLAQARQDSDCFHITALKKGRITELNVEGEQDSHFTLALPDKEVMVKRLFLNRQKGWDTELQVQFELTQSLLENGKDNFAFDTLATGLKERYLGLLTRQRNVEKPIPAAAGLPSPALTYEMRAVALGKGFLHFCRHNPEELTAIADFYDEGISLCFVYNSHIVDVAYLSTAYLPEKNETDPTQITAELKTVISFRTATLAEAGTPPHLSALFISGLSVETPLEEALKRQFQPLPVTSPVLKSEVLSEEILERSSGNLEEFLVALGLAVDYPC